MTDERIEVKMAVGNGYRRYDELDTKVAALDETIRALRKADRWRLRKRNKPVIAMVKATRQRLLVDFVSARGAETNGPHTVSDGGV